MAALLLCAGALLLVEVAVTLVWREPVTSLLTTYRQHQLRGELEALTARGAQVPPAVKQQLERLPDRRARTAFLARRLRLTGGRGDPVGRLRIPRAGVDVVLVDGAAPSDLRRGPGLFDRSPFPGERGTVAVAGHRTTYGAPFRHIDRLRRGDRITVDLPYGRFTYRVDGHRIVAPTEVSVIRHTDRDRLVLTACHPIRSAARRYVVFASSVDPRSGSGGGRRTFRSSARPARTPAAR